MNRTARPGVLVAGIAKAALIRSDTPDVGLSRACRGRTAIHQLARRSNAALRPASRPEVKAHAR
jgi:hypothetical protein